MEQHVLQRLASLRIFCFYSQFLIFEVFACIYQYFEGLDKNYDEAGGDLPDREPPMFPPHSVFSHAPSKVNSYILGSRMLLVLLTPMLGLLLKSEKEGSR